MIDEQKNKVQDKFFITIVSLFLVLSFIGIIDSTFLTIEHFKNNNSVVCLIIGGCDTVLKSEYSSIFRIPIAVLGLLYYLFIFLTTIFSFRQKKEMILKHISIFTVFGFIVSLIFIYLQVFIINAICTYCLLSAFTSTSLFIFGLIFLVNFRRRNDGIKKIENKKGES